MGDEGEKAAYYALALPADALDNGGVEILRAGLINQRLYVSAMRAFDDPSAWGDVLADVARRIAQLFAAEDTSLTEKEILVMIEQAFAADLGAPIIKDKPTKRTPTKRRASKKPGVKKAVTKSVKSAGKKVAGKKAAKRKKR